MTCDKVHQGRREDLADDVGDMRAAAGACYQQSPCFQRLQRVAQDRPRDFEIPRQVAFSGQPVADAQHPFEDQPLDLLHHLVGRARMLDPGKDVAQSAGSPFGPA